MEPDRNPDYCRLKVGDVVTVQDIPVFNKYFYPTDSSYNMSYTKEMKGGYAGTTTYITKVIEEPYGNLYKIAADQGLWHWTDDFLNASPTTNKKAKGLLMADPYGKEEYQ